MYKVCRHIQPDGSRCQAAALRDMPYCYHHNRIHRALLRQRSAPKNKLELPVLEDRRSIMEALSQIIGALAAGRLDGANAGRLIYGLQVAAQYGPAFCTSRPSYHPVESVTLTSDGDELAPAKFECDEEEDCQTCPYYDECNRKIVAGDDEDDDEDEDDDFDDDDEDEGGPKDSGDDSDDADDDEGDNDDDGEEDKGDYDESTEQLVADVKRLESVRDAFESGDVLPLVRLISE